jgi:hypothetical protein
MYQFLVRHYVTMEFFCNCRRYWLVETKNRAANSTAPSSTPGPYPPSRNNNYSFLMPGVRKAFETRLVAQPPEWWNKHSCTMLHSFSWLELKPLKNCYFTTSYEFYVMQICTHYPKTCFTWTPGPPAAYKVKSWSSWNEAVIKDCIHFS